MKIPCQPKRPKLVKLTADGYDLEWLTHLRVATKSKHLSMPQKCAALDCLPEQYRFGVQPEVVRARREYLDYLTQESRRDTAQAPSSNKFA